MPSTAINNQTEATTIVLTDTLPAYVQSAGAGRKITAETLFNSGNLYPVSGLVGFGTATPENYSNDANNIVIYEAANAGLTIATGTTNTGAVYFADGTTGADAYRGFLRYDHSNSTLNLGVDGSLKMTLYTTYTEINTIQNTDNGTAGAPAYAFQDNTDMGMYRAAIGNLAFATQGVQAIVINSSQLVGINKAIPLGRLHVATNASGVLTVPTGGDELLIENNAAAGLSILTPNTATASIYFSDPDDNDVGYLQYNHSTDTATIAVAATAVMSIVSTGVNVTGTMAATTVTGANVTTGADPGHTHTNYITSNIADTVNADTTWNDGQRIQAGTGGDFRFYHDGSNSYISNITGTIIVQVNTVESAITAAPNGAVTLYYDDSIKLATTNVGINITGMMSSTGNQIIIETSQTPASAGATGTTGTIAWDADYIYVCTATNTWKRVAIATW